MRRVVETGRRDTRRLRCFRARMVAFFSVLLCPFWCSAVPNDRGGRADDKCGHGNALVVGGDKRPIGSHRVQRVNARRLTHRPGAPTRKRFFTFILAASALSACASVAPTYRDPAVAMTSMATFDPEEYQGVWYEVARFPNLFQAGCERSTATYQVVSPGTLAIENACIRNGATKSIRGSARVVGPGRLAVRLDGVPVTAPYWVLWVDQDYSTAVVGVPSGRAGWILNRSPSISADRLNAARRVLAFNGYDLSELMIDAGSSN